MIKMMMKKLKKKLIMKMQKWNTKKYNRKVFHLFQ